MNFDNQINLVIVLLMAIYACYSWYWQAIVEYRAQYRYSGIVWTFIFIWLLYPMAESGGKIIVIFLALFILIGVVDGFSGFAKKRVVLSGYFKRTLPFERIQQVTVLNVPNPVKPQVVCIFKADRQRSYMLKFMGTLSDVLGQLKTHLNDGVEIEVQTPME
ncbi:hypothetical protein [Lactobacillus corticis]|uniref:Uncharacterized protein n=1 Tax=Lactobacillus corticis TaxID=2201249 RepID=A0A916VJC1_9LACO|nr:hypothetical protein [Lactobacillus corticis]GFZ27644.1 hypothetical protein LCB40_15240 [Lactobacillus corticis]